MANAVAGHKRAHETYIGSLDIDYIFSIMKHFKSSKNKSKIKFWDIVTFSQMSIDYSTHTVNIGSTFCVCHAFIQL